MKFTLTGMLALLCMAAQAQDPDLAPGKSISQKANTLHYGIKAALNFSGVKGNGMKTSMVAGGELGAFVDYDLSKHWAIQIEGIASQNSVKRGDDFFTYYNTDGYTLSADKAKLTYLNIPLLARYRISEEWSFVVGPQIGFLLNDNENYLNYNRRAFKTSEVAGVAGAEFNISSVALFARYQFGITNINDVDTRYEWRARHLQIGIAVKIK
ncbi:MAG: PorT family protein [Bacteroidetes bacterium]|nr:PorT family protein [Bacteroidota bacterium]